MKSANAFTEFEQIIDRLENLSEDLIAVIDNQIDAVVASNEEQIEKYVSQYATLKGAFKEQEQKFIDHLQMMLENSGVNSVDVRLESLKEGYPQEKNQIADWQVMLKTQMSTLKKKQEKLNKLLEFAVEKNMQLMHSIYRLHNKKNTRYSSGGTKEEISSGIALNKEA